ncbi:MAG: glutamine amidotransferase [Planctomycetes bacterium]|nr:glutamine amidotransferase [Planctomycetota bacterium]
MPISFAAPEFLPLIPLLWVLVWLIGRRSLAGLERGRRRAALALRLLVVTLIVLGLAEVEWRDTTERLKVVVVLDHSRSIPDEQTALALRLVDEAKRRMDPRKDTGELVVFGREAFVEASLGRDDPPLGSVASPLERGYTNIEAALRRALEAIDEGTRGRIVLVSDGNQTLGDASAAVARARAAQVPVDVIPLEYAYEQEVLVEKIVLPPEAKVGEPFLARVVAHAMTRTPARMRLWQGGELVETRDVVLQAGANVEQFQLDLKRPDFYRVEASVEPLDARQDRLVQNNTAHGFVFARGKAQVLYVHDDADPEAREAEHLLAALTDEQIRVVAVPAANFPLEPMALQGYDAVILDDVARPSLSARQQAAIEQAVGDMGIGLIMIGGERSFGAGEWRGSPVEKALPVEMDIKQEEVIPDGALVMIIHSCEFEEGNAAAIKVVNKAIDGLSAKDTVGVLIYGNSGNEWAVAPQKALNKPGLKAQVTQMQAGDMPDFDGIFRMALEALKGTNASVKHMIVMSDGDPSPPSPALLGQCRDNRISVSTICYFAHDGAQGASAQTMRRIANVTGGKFYYLDDPKDLPRLFIKEAQRVSRSLIVNQTFVPTPRTPSPVLTGVQDLPQLTGFVLTEPKPRAEVALVAKDGSPILAHWQYGVGKSLAFTSDARPRWATSWVQWPGFRRFWSQAVRWVSKDVQDSVFQTSTFVKGDRGVIVLDAVTAEGELLDGMTVTARVTAPLGGEAREVHLRQRGSGRYEGDFPVSEVGTYTVSLLTRDQDGRASHSLTTGLVFPYSDEFKRLRSDRPFLEELARQGDGQVLRAEDVLAGQVNLWDRARLGKRVALEERWTWALALGLCLFLLDVAARRVAIDWAKVLARGRAALTRSAPPAPATMDRLRERKQVVREETTQPKFAPTGPPPADATVAGAAPLVQGPAGAPRPAGAPKVPPPAAPPAGKSEGDFTNRLLAAKRRARQELGEQPPGDGQGPGT